MTSAAAAEAPDIASPRELPPVPPPAAVPTALGAVECAVGGEGPALLALHGAMGGYDQSWLLARVLATPGYRVVAPSRPGYLGTPLARAASPDAQADLYAALLDALEVDRAAVFAVSGAGPSAIRFALRHPDRCRALVLVSTQAVRVTERLPFVYWVLTGLGRIRPVAAWMARQGAKDPEARDRRALPDPVGRARVMSDPFVRELFGALQASTSDRMWLRIPGTVNDVKATRTCDHPLEQLRVPVLVVHGTADPHVPFAKHGEVLAQRIPGARLCALEGGEHAAIFTHRTAARAAVATFLRGLH